MENSPEDTRQRIIDAALRLFGEVGYARASTRAIAEAAGVNEVTLFRHFGSKKNLLIASMEAFNQAGFAQSFRAHLTGDYLADIRMMADLQIEDMVARFNGLRLMFCEASTVLDLHEAMLTGAASNTSLLAAYFADQIAAGVVRADLPPQALVEAFNGLFASNLVFQGMLEDPPGPQRPSRRLFDALVSIFVGGTQAASWKES